MQKLSRAFFQQPTLKVAEALIGKQLIKQHDGETIVGKIVETEAYIGPEDRAAHTYGGRRTKRNETMFGEAGHAYVYIIYGIHHCINCVTVGPNAPEGVLLRAVEPIAGLESMAQRRFQRSYEMLTTAQRRQLTNGPGKLGQAFGITRDKYNGHDLQSESLYISDGDDAAISVATSPRVGIDASGEAKHYPWRFFAKDHAYVSKRPKAKAD
ncbi:DNA-3-methyladenine glycosylase [Natribacillus halophilus]|uniref:Putative 3-methyladenine DNA glycosylase n=1 Tax=Natribacillus halophilus TaxID=549003 RepID=A0A1G8J4B6_9BACI|nr:DNA-3-methyladenine glycosylase [Natribacillus halophilus]SDI26095.1 DNA-3-methyladenine glycosylase [Natribacillus halophilus]